MTEDHDEFYTPIVEMVSATREDVVLIGMEH